MTQRKSRSPMQSIQLIMVILGVVLLVIAFFSSGENSEGAQQVSASAPEEHTLSAPPGRFVSKRVPEGHCLRYTTRKPEANRIEIEVGDNSNGNFEVQTGESVRFRSRLNSSVTVYYYTARLGSPHCQENKYGELYRDDLGLH